jgi:predicted DCC family thiol-disulfide oxidoreductase YuxK
MMITVFYDGACGLCSREIAYYRRIAPQGIFNWIDITQTPQPFLDLGYTVAEGLKLLHAQTEQGKMVIGIEAFILIWQKLPYWKLLAACANIPLIKPSLQFAYKSFAAWRFKRLGYDNSCKF